MRIKQAVILAAGEGQRLKPFTATKPKVMLSIAGKPILQYVVESSVQSGIRHIIMVVGYKKEQVFDHFGSGEELGAELEYVVQAQQLGTAHALKQAEGKVSDNFLILPGDNIIEAETIVPLLELEPDTILTKEQRNVSQYGAALVERGALTQLVEKPKEPLSRLASTGIYLFSPHIFPFIGEELEIPEVLRGMLSQGRRITALETQGAWLDVVYPWDILKVNEIVLRRISPSARGTIEKGVTIKGTVSIGKGSVIRANSYILGPVHIGEGCEIGPNACIFPATAIGNRAVVHPLALLRNSVIGEEVKIGPSSVIEDSVIDRGSWIGGHFIAQSGEAEVKIGEEYHTVVTGAMVGEHCHIGSNVTVAPGTVLGNWVRIKGLRIIEGNIPDESLVV